MNRSEFDSLKKKHESLQANVLQSDSRLDSIRTSLTSHETTQKQYQGQLEELNTVHLAALATKLGQTVSNEEFKSLKASTDKVKIKMFAFEANFLRKIRNIFPTKKKKKAQTRNRPLEQRDSGREKEGGRAVEVDAKR